jgi:hypothetical protein
MARTPSTTTSGNERILLGLLTTGILYVVVLLLASVQAVDRAAASVVLILGIYLSSRPANILHPVTPVFLNYMLYLVMPYTLFLVYKVWAIEYILPWGLLYDWGALSDQAVQHFEISFVLFYSCLYLFAGTRGEGRGVAGALDENEVKWGGVIVMSVAITTGCFVFLNHTGGVSAWLSSYSDTYINRRGGAGGLNFALLNGAHVLAFVAGWMCFRGKRRVPKWLWALVLVPLLFCMILQGIKSRIPNLLLFFLMPKLFGMKIKVGKGITAFIVLMVSFMVSMYFRSEGFYGTPRMAIEYLQSYFNTIFLHDLALQNYAPGELNSMFMGITKYTELFVGKLPREQYDLSVALTQKFYPKDWYGSGATQQWPIETDLYLTLPSAVFWVLPVAIYTLLLGQMYRLAARGSPILMYIYTAEFARMISIFRSGLLTWDALVQIGFYAFVYLYCSTQVFSRASTPRMTPVPARLVSGGA